VVIYGTTVDDARALGVVERLLEDSWVTRSRQASSNELIVEAAAAVLFLAIAVPLAISSLQSHSFDAGIAVLLVALYAVVSGAIKFPIGAGYVVPSYLILVPMLLLLPPGVVPLLAAAGLVGGTLVRVAVGRAGVEQALFSIPDALHTLGPALVLTLAVGVHHGATLAIVFLGAFLAGCLIDLVAATARESAALGVAPRIQVRVIAVVWVIDACIAPLGLLVALAARPEPALLLLLLPLTALVVLVDRDRSARITEARRRLDLVALERTRLQAAVGRLGEAFAAKLDLRALGDVVLHGSMDAVGGDAGHLILHPTHGPEISGTSGDPELLPLLESAARAVAIDRQRGQFDRDGAWALALPIILGDAGDGALVVARRDRAFRDDEQELVAGLVERAQDAAAEIVAHDTLREQAITDPLTGLGNRRKLADELRERLAHASATQPLVLLLFDLDGFKSYNDTYGHLAGDALLARLGGKLAAAVAHTGDAFRLGGDEFCVLISAQPDELTEVVTAAAEALEERGETFAVRASCGAVILPHEASNGDYALQLADKRMYSRKHGRSSIAVEQAADVLRHVMHVKQPGLSDHSSSVAELSVRVGRRFGMSAEQLDEVARAAELHDVGKVGIPDAILEKPGPLNGDEWQYIRQHTVIGERILSATPALRPVAAIVRSSHERWDGVGYPDGLRGAEIPLGARIIEELERPTAVLSPVVPTSEDERAELVAEITSRVREVVAAVPA
jgi:diguanylate cyclase (GGDEF)-like protein